jgi:hypothetical protein
MAPSYFYLTQVKLGKSEVAAIAEVDTAYFSNVVEEMSQVTRFQLVLLRLLKVLRTLIN